MTHSLSRRRAMALAAAGLALPMQARAAPAPVLVELFTSQGCSSCPPADVLLGKLAARDDVIAMSLNVDYWDYLGWRDTLAKPEYSQRQFDYGKSRGDMQVYTPQVVVNGRYHAVGSRSSDVEDAIAKARKSPADVPVSIHTGKSDIVVNVADGDFDGEATLWLMAIAPKIAQKIERGENAGKSVAYHNVVRSMVPGGMWKGKAAELSLMKSAVMTPDCRSCVAVLQQDKTGVVLGLTRWNYSKW